MEAVENKGNDASCLLPDFIDGDWMLNPATELRRVNDSSANESLIFQLSIEIDPLSTHT
jgi:hypothetical protein